MDTTTTFRPYGQPDPTAPQEPADSIKQNFPSYLDVPSLPANIRTICEILATGDPRSVDASLDSLRLTINQIEVEQVLKLSYSFPSSAAVFFRWAGTSAHDHSPYSWNLMVDLLGKNAFFEPMWDAIKSMHWKKILSISTFASVFCSYVAAGRVHDAILTFEVMERYGCPRDVVALNSLISAICRDGNTRDAAEFVRYYTGEITPDPDTYAILLEGWERECDVSSAGNTFSDMVSAIGWVKENVSAYEAYLCTVLGGVEGIRESIKMLNLITERGCDPGVRFFPAALEECLKSRDAESAEFLWEKTMEAGAADAGTYHVMMRVYCDAGDGEKAKRLLDRFLGAGGYVGREMCDSVFLCLVRGRRLNEASQVLGLMVENGWVPDRGTSDVAVRVAIECNNVYLACEIWRCMMGSYEGNMEGTGNWLVVRLCEFKLGDEAKRIAEEMVSRGIVLSGSTHFKLKQCIGGP